MSGPTQIAAAEPDREPTNFKEYVRELEADPKEKAALEQARVDLRKRLEDS